MVETDSGGFPVQVDSLDAGWLLALAEEAEADSRAAERRKLRYAAQWCAINPPTAHDEAIGGEGTPLVAAFAAEQFAAALGVSTTAGLQLMADSLHLQHRLPLIWARVESLGVAPWRARRVARASASLPEAAVALVDAQLVDLVDSCGAARIDRAIAEARAAVAPDERMSEEDRARESWGVRLDHGTPGDWAGTSSLQATGDTLDLTSFHHLVDTTAEELRINGDEGDLEVRQARALGVIARRAHGDSGPRPDTRLYLHVVAEDLDDEGAMGRTDAVVPHDPPAWMREHVILRDRHCVFPWCHRDARGCDLDHVEPYDENGPPGQTNPENLAPLCRRHHRCKTSGRWRYVREPEGSYTWRSPTGWTYLVTADVTRAVR